MAPFPPPLAYPAFLPFVSFVHAAPLVTATLTAYDPGAAWLGIFFGFFTLAAALSSAKYLYLKQRRATLIAHSDCSSSSCVAAKGLTNASESSSKPCPLSKNGILSAFLVGFLGSPTMEISVHILHTDGRSLFTQSTRSTSSWKSHSLKGRTKTKPSMNEFGEKLSDWRTISTIAKSSKSLYSLPSYYETAIPLPTTPTSSATRQIPKLKQLRRSSLPASPPSRNVVEYDAASVQKRHSSLRCNKRRRSSSFLPPSSSVRMVDNEMSRDHPLPLSPEEAATSAEKFFKLSRPEGSESKRKDCSIPPVPAIPRSAVLRGQPSPLVISRPYPLMSYAKRSKSVPHESAEQAQQSGSMVEKAPFQSPLIPQNPPLPSSHLVSTILSYPSPHPSPHPSEPIPPLPKLRKVSQRSRRSPTIGPSPLRNMTLPEASLTELARLDSSLPDARQSTTFSDYSNRNSYSNVGLGFPPSESKRSSRMVIFDADEDDKRSSISSRRLTRVSREDDGNNVLLGFIRELVEETSSWDASLYMDNGFRHMLDDIVSQPSQASLMSPPRTGARRSVAGGSPVDEGLAELAAVRASYISETSIDGVGVAR